MHTVNPTDFGVLELNWMWLPTWVGMNASLQKELEAHLKSRFAGLTTSEADLKKIDEMVFDFIVAKAPHVEGLRDYLDGLKFVTIKS